MIDLKDMTVITLQFVKPNVLHMTIGKLIGGASLTIREVPLFLNTCSHSATLPNLAVQPLVHTQ